MAINKKRREVIEQWMLKHHIVPGFSNKLDKMAQLIRELFIAQKQNTFPEFRLNDIKNPPDFWRSVAIKVLDQDMDPADYVFCIFAEYGPSMHTNMINSSDALAIYRKRVDDKGKILQLEVGLSLHVQKLQQRIGEKHAPPLPEILLNDDNTFNPVFVYCVAVDAELEDVAAEVQHAAKFRLNRRAYREVYARAFPGVINGSD